MINWKVRIKNRQFWVCLIPALLLLVKQIGVIFGFDIDVSVLTEQLLDVIATIFLILAVVGIVNDPTTNGLSDSAQALTYEEPKDDYKF